MVFIQPKIELAPKDKARFYRIARRSATECAAILDVCRRLDLVPLEKLASARDLLLRLVAMQIKMAIECEQPSGSGSGTHTGTGTAAGS